MRARILTVVPSLLGAVLAAALTVPAARADEPMHFTTVRLPGIDGSGAEPRIAVAPDDTRYAETNDRSKGGRAVLFRSIDAGETWQRTEAEPAQTKATIDVDVVAMRTGRILTSELDEAGLNFPSSYTDDRGRSFTETKGATRLADQDRQWFAVGPDDPQTHKPRVYLLFHNLGSGTANHNMFVSTSTDGGETFGVPVPVTLPGDTAYADLQCADSGGPSNIAVNPRTGRIYVFFTTRSGQIGPGNVDTGGCTAQPLEFNIVNGTRVWAATSPDGSPGSWKQSLAVDDSRTGQVVSMQLAYGALDNRGGVYVAYPESPRPYPDLNGAAVKLRHQDPAPDGTLADDRWSAPLTLVPASDPGGSTLVHLAVGDPGKVAVAYYRGESVAGQDKPVWYTHVVHSLDALSGQPTIVDQRVSDVPAYRWTASEMMGICAPSATGPAQGPYNGLVCRRSTDVWGIALDRGCRLSLVWPTSQDRPQGGTAGVPGSSPGTYVSTQDGGPDLCASPGDAPASSTFAPPPRGTAGSLPSGCRDQLAPRSRVVGRIRASRRGVRFAGRSRDRGCAGRVRFVRVAVGRHLRGSRCRYLRGDGGFGPVVSCLRTTYLPTRGSAARWRYRFSGRLPRGRYVVWVRGIDRAGNVERKARRVNLARFRVR